MNEKEKRIENQIKILNLKVKLNNSLLAIQEELENNNYDIIDYDFECDFNEIIYNIIKMTITTSREL